MSWGLKGKQMRLKLRLPLSGYRKNLGIILSLIKAYILGFNCNSIGSLSQ